MDGFDDSLNSIVSKQELITVINELPDNARWLILLAKDDPNEPECEVVRVEAGPKLRLKDMLWYATKLYEYCKEECFD